MSGPGAGAGGMAFVLLFFAVAVLAAMAAVGGVGDREVRRLQDVTGSRIEPASRLAARLGTLHATEMAALQTFLLTGTSTDRLRYGEAMAQSQAMEESLGVLVEALESSVREAFFELGDAAFRWRSHARPVLSEEVSRREFVADLDQERRLFSGLQGEMLGLEAAISAEAARIRGQVADAQERQRAWTLVLSALALLSALGLAGVALHLQSLARDMARRRRDAARARAETAAVLNAAADGVLGLDRSGRCTFINETASLLLGVPRHGALGQEVRRLIRGDGVGPVVAPSGPEASAVEVEEVFVERRGADAFPARLASHPVPGGGSSLARVVTIADMTVARAAADELRRAVAAREQVLAVVSHDLRNPLGIVQAGSELLLTMELPREKQEEQLGVIHRSALRMARLIRDLLDVSAMDSGGFSVRRGRVDLDGLLAAVVSEMRTEAERSAGVVELDVGPEVSGLCVEGDWDRLLQALLNLAGNALKFSPPGGRVAVGAALDPGDGEQRVHITVDDQGPGVPEELRDRLFEPFRQGERGDRRGAGLGLAIVRGIVTAHGGQVKVADSPDGGARFVVSLPLVRAAGDSPSTPGATRPRSTSDPPPPSG